MKKSTQIVLKKCAVPPHLLGYDYLGEAAELVRADRSYLRGITSKLYPAIAKKLGTTKTAVERGIRHAVECAIDNLTPGEIKEIFGNTIRYDKGKHTNAHFIAVVAELLEE